MARAEHRESLRSARMVADTFGTVLLHTSWESSVTVESDKNADGSRPGARFHRSPPRRRLKRRRSTAERTFLKRWALHARCTVRPVTCGGGSSKALLGQEPSIDSHRVTNHETCPWRAKPDDGCCDFFGLAKASDWLTRHDDLDDLWIVILRDGD